MFGLGEVVVAAAFFLFLAVTVIRRLTGGKSPAAIDAEQPQPLRATMVSIGTDQDYLGYRLVSLVVELEGAPLEGDGIVSEAALQRLQAATTVSIDSDDWVDRIWLPSEGSVRPVAAEVARRLSGEMTDEGDGSFEVRSSRDGDELTLLIEDDGWLSIDVERGVAMREETIQLRALPDGLEAQDHERVVGSITATTWDDDVAVSDAMVERVRACHDRLHPWLSHFSNMVHLYPDSCDTYTQLLQPEADLIIDLTNEFIAIIDALNGSDRPQWEETGGDWA